MHDLEEENETQILIMARNIFIAIGAVALFFMMMAIVKREDDHKKEMQEMCPCEELKSDTIPVVRQVDLNAFQKLIRSESEFVVIDTFGIWHDRREFYGLNEDQF